MSHREVTIALSAAEAEWLMHVTALMGRVPLHVKSRRLNNGLYGKAVGALADAMDRRRTRTRPTSVQLRPDRGVLHWDEQQRLFVREASGG